MPLPQDPIGIELAKTVYRQQYENQLSAQVEAILRDTWRAVYDEMNSSRWATLTQFQRDRQTQLFVEINQIINTGYGRVQQFSAAELVDYAALEQQAALTTLQTRITAAGGPIQSSFRLLSQQMVLSIAELPIQGLKLGEWWTHATTNMGVLMRRTLQQGLLAGQGPHVIARHLLGVQGDGIVTMRSLREARALARTAVNAVQNHAATETYKRVGAQVTPGYQWVSARDNRVTPICRGLDGKIFKYDDPKAPLPPAHFQCRSTTVPELNWKALGMRQPGPNHPLGFSSYSRWLKTQPKSEQDAILGRAGASVWRSGKVDLADLVQRDGRRLTLEQLRRKFGADRVSR